jgi:hypothetical protein
MWFPNVPTYMQMVMAPPPGSGTANNCGGQLQWGKDGSATCCGALSPSVGWRAFAVGKGWWCGGAAVYEGNPISALMPADVSQLQQMPCSLQGWTSSFIGKEEVAAAMAVAISLR